jgi:hypothetical protein
MKTVIEMAREAGFHSPVRADGYMGLAYDRREGRETGGSLERFAGLVRADQDEKYKWDIHSCGPTCTKVACVAMREAVKAEREECAKVAETYREWDDTGMGIAETIRARSNT